MKSSCRGRRSIARERWRFSSGASSWAAFRWPRALRMTPSAVSKLVARLERRLGARLINRSTRKLLLTAEGQAFLERAHRVLADLDEAERAVTAGAVPRGLVRVNCNVPFGLHRLLPLVPRFTAAHPEVRLDIALTDRVIDLMDERSDVAIRVGSMRPSQLMACKLGQSRMAVVAAPAYLARRGVPQTPYDLDAHKKCHRADFDAFARPRMRRGFKR